MISHLPSGSHCKRHVKRQTGFLSRQPATTITTDDVSTLLPQPQGFGGGGGCSDAQQDMCIDMYMWVLHDRIPLSPSHLVEIFLTQARLFLLSNVLSCSFYSHLP